MFKELILEQVERFKAENNRSDIFYSLEHNNIGSFLKGDEQIQQMTDFQIGFLCLFKDESFEYKVFTKKRFNEVLQYAREFYDSSRIQNHHILEHDLYPPSEENDKWSLVYEVQGGDLIIYANFKGFEFEGLGASH